MVNKKKTDTNNKLLVAAAAVLFSGMLSLSLSLTTHLKLLREGDEAVKSGERLLLLLSLQCSDGDCCSAEIEKEIANSGQALSGAQAGQTRRRENGQAYVLSEGAGAVVIFASQSCAAAAAAAAAAFKATRFS